MPFITKDRRRIIDAEGLNGLYRDHMTINIPDRWIMPGDRCYLYYKEMVRRWKENPRWKTAHEIYRELCENPLEDYDNVAAKELAWQVFFIKYVIKYEDQKEIENGTI